MKDMDYFRRWFLIIFALFCVGMNVVAFILYEKNQQVFSSKQWVSHTYLVMTEAYRAYADILDMQTAQRGYLLTGQEKFLGPYNSSRADLTVTMTRLSGLTVDNEDRQDNIRRYETAQKNFEEVLDNHIKIWRETNSVEKIDFVESKQAIDVLRKIHSEIISAEMDLLSKREAEARGQQKNYIATLFATAGFAAIGLLIANAVVGVLTYRRKYAEEDLKRINKEMEGFTYIASHDLRSPLVNLKGFATEMAFSMKELEPIIERVKSHMPEADRKKTEEILDEEMPDALRYIHSSVEKMDKLTNAILELSRIGRRNIEFKPVDTGMIVRHILDTLHHTIATKNIGVTVHPLPEVIADQMSLEHIFSNIIDNAIKYMHPDRRGLIEIGGIKSYRETKFWVKDNGRGINSGDHHKIFEIYRRAGNTDNIPGEGMGMAYVRAALRRLGGQIWCESVQGLGTTFYFTISNTLHKEVGK